MSRPRPETIPAVTVPPSPKGFPTATTQSPTRVRSESPNSTTGSDSSESTSMSARSVFGSTPTTSASSLRPSRSVTVTESAPLTTWWLVTMSPEASTMNPEPTPSARGVPGMANPGIDQKCRKISGSSPPCLRHLMRDCAAGRMARVTSTLTTAGRTSLTRSAKPPCIVDIMAPPASGAAFAGLQGSLTATAPTIAADTAAATSVRPVQGLLRVVVLLVMRLPSCVQFRNRRGRFNVRAGWDRAGCRPVDGS